MMDETQTQSFQPPAGKTRKPQGHRSFSTTRSYTVVNQTRAVPSELKPKKRLLVLEGKKIPDRTGSFSSPSEAEEITLLRERLVAAVQSVCPYWLRDHQQDIVQEAIMAVLKQRANIKARGEIPSCYLRRAAFTAMIDEMRRRRSRGEAPPDADDEERILIEGRAGPERRMMAREISAAIRACLDLMAQPRREAVTLHLLAWKIPQIAKGMGWNKKRADNLVYRGMDGLRGCLREKGFQP